jgi:hypothetical protein
MASRTGRSFVTALVPFAVSSSDMNMTVDWSGGKTEVRGFHAEILVGETANSITDVPFSIPDASHPLPGDALDKTGKKNIQEKKSGGGGEIEYHGPIRPCYLFFFSLILADRTVSSGHVFRNCGGTGRPGGGTTAADAAATVAAGGSVVLPSIFFPLTFVLLWPFFGRNNRYSAPCWDVVARYNQSNTASLQATTTT